MSQVEPNDIVTADELHELIKSGSNLAVLDLRYSPAGDQGYDDYLVGHVPGAIYADLATQFADPLAEGRGRRPLPTTEALEETVRSWGLRDGMTVVVYDGGNNAPAARAWWTLKWGGVARVRVLLGGFPRWKASGYRVETGAPAAAPFRGDIVLTGDGLPVLDVEDVLSFATDGLLLDARPAADFSSTGHIPLSASLPAASLVNASAFLSPSVIKGRLQELGAVQDQPVAAYCGAGVAGRLVVLALRSVGVSAALYPGSWSEWTLSPDRPVAKA